jgi:hypothetical protein
VSSVASLAISTVSLSLIFFAAVDVPGKLARCAERRTPRPPLAPTSAVARTLDLIDAGLAHEWEFVRAHVAWGTDYFNHFRKEADLEAQGVPRQACWEARVAGRPFGGAWQEMRTRELLRLPG